MKAKTAAPKKTLIDNLRTTVLGLRGKLPTAPAEEVAKWIKKGAILLDVRTPIEASKVPVPGSTNIPMLMLKGRLSELPPKKMFVTFCLRGGRAERAKNLLLANGRKAINGGGYKSMLKILESNPSGPADAAPRK
jgi:rhodanese-related sulfurtransferase